MGLCRAGVLPGKCSIWQEERVLSRGAGSDYGAIMSKEEVRTGGGGKQKKVVESTDAGCSWIGPSHVWWRSDENQTVTRPLFSDTGCGKIGQQCLQSSEWKSFSSRNL